MSATTSFCCAAALALAIPIAAQQTWIVDALNRPGANFTDIQPAVNAAAPGDVIRVRNTPQAYGPATIGRGIALLGESPAPTLPTITISGVPANERCSVASFQVNGSYFVDRVTVVGCIGHVHLESLTMPLAWLFENNGFLIQGSPHVTLTRCTGSGSNGAGMSCTASTVDVVDCVLAGNRIKVPGSPGLIANGSRVTLAQTTVTTNMPPQPGISATNSILFITGSRTSIHGTGGPDSVASGATTLYVGNAQPFTWTGGSRVLRTLPALSATRMDAPSMTLTLEGPTGAACATVASLPSGPVTLGFGDLWLDPNGAVIIDVGTLTGGTRSFATPISPFLPQGFAAGCQSLVLDTSSLMLSTAVVVIRY